MTETEKPLPEGTENSMTITLKDVCLVVIAVCVVIATFSGWNAF